MATTNGNAITTDPASDARSQLVEAIGSADTVANQGVAALQQVHQARLSQANRTVAALTAQYGAKDPRVQIAQAAATATQTTISRVSALRQQMATPTVQPAQSGWALQGLVLDAQLKPAARFTVFFVDTTNAFLQQYGFAYTDDTGYFVINYAGVAAEAPAAPQLFIEVVNTEANPVYLSTTAFEPVPGTASFQNIVLPAGGQPIGDPPPEIRRIAMPNQQPQPPAGTNPSTGGK
jgi:hypothetical protein